MNAFTPTLRRPNPRDQVRDLRWQTKRWGLDTKKHGLKVAWVLDRLEYSANAKREIERMAQIADKHYCSYINEARNPWAVKTYDPVIFSTAQARLAKTADALFSGGSIFTYQPGDGSRFEQAEAMTSVVDYHLQEIRPRNRLLKGFLGNMLAGTQAWHIWWDYRRRKRQFWQRVPKKVAIRDLQTGAVHPIWVEDGDWAYVKQMRTWRDSPNLRPLHITQWYPDDTVEDVQDGEFFMFVDVISAEDARERVETDGWDPRAVERAISGTLPEKGAISLRSAQDWQEEMGMRPTAIRRYLANEDGEGQKERSAVEVIECWRRRNFGLERTIVLQRSWIAFDGPSPFGHGLYPFVVTRNYPLHGRFWGLSDYQVIRWLNRGIQAMRGAAGTEAVHGAMPPLLLPHNIKITGKRWGEVGGEWVHNGPPNWAPQFLQPGLGRNIAHSEAETLMARMDAALGSSDPGRGATGDKDVKATALNIAFQAAGMRDKLLIDNFADDFILPVGDQFQELVQQFQTREVEIQITGRQDREPVTVFPDEYRDASLYGSSTASTSALKALKEKRVGDLWERSKKFPSQNFNERAIDELYIEQTAPEWKDRVMRSEAEIQQMQQQMQQQGMPGQVRMGPPGGGGPPALPPGPAQPGGPGGAIGAPDPLGQQSDMAELAAAYGLG